MSPLRILSETITLDSTCLDCAVVKETTLKALGIKKYLVHVGERRRAML